MTRGTKGLVFGVGVNDADYQVSHQIAGKNVLCPAYSTWNSMLRRAYSQVYQARYPAYIGVTVCDEWHHFMSFKKWFDENYVDGYHLDKDIMFGAREYSPSNCIFVPRWLNNFITDSKGSRGAYPIGVYFDTSSGSFRAKCNNPVTKKVESIGRFDSPDKAHAAWKRRKLEHLSVMSPEIEKIKPGLTLCVERAVGRMV